MHGCCLVMNLHVSADFTSRAACILSESTPACMHKYTVNTLCICDGVSWSLVNELYTTFYQSIKSPKVTETLAHYLSVTLGNNIY